MIEIQSKSANGNTTNFNVRLCFHLRSCEPSKHHRTRTSSLLARVSEVEGRAVDRGMRFCHFTSTAAAMFHQL